MENQALIPIILLLFAGGGAAGAHAGHLLIYEVSPYSYPGTHMDYVCIYNPTGSALTLENLTLTDFEGTVLLHGTVAPGAKIYIAQNATAFKRFFGFFPNYTFMTLPHTGRFALSNSGDELALEKDGNVIDMVSYGNSNYSGAGWNGPPVQVREGHILRRLSAKDTDTAADWSNYHRIGQSDFKNLKVQANVELLTLPDDRGEILRFIRESRKTLELEMYTLSDLQVVKELIAQKKAGVNVSVLVEGAPVGGMRNDERFALHMLTENGITVKMMVSNFGAHNRYTFVHAKFMVRDNKSAMILTENLDSLTPCGNRGFGVIVRNGRIAAYLEQIFHDDSKNVQDIRAYENLIFHAPAPQRIEVRASEFAPENLSATVSFIIAPDFSMAEFDRFIKSQKSLDVEAMYLRELPLEEAYPRARRILVEYPKQGYDMHRFNSQALHVRMLHGKMMIGTNAVLLGSMNFGNYSMMQNREVSIVLHSHSAVNYYEKVFNHDWHAVPEPEAIMRCTIEGNGISVDMSQSRGRIEKFEIYLDGKNVYSGKRAVVHIHTSPGTHTLAGKIITANGQDTVYEKIHVPGQSAPDSRLIGFAFIFAVFFYKLWKDHG
ncbi:MAG: phospholipase [Euryarchaeota archaeon]|nr:phospholipase [Euryarchaeota archaeon]